MPTLAVGTDNDADGEVLIPAPSGLYAFIRVWGYNLVVAGATNLGLKSGSTFIDGPMPFSTAGDGLVNRNYPTGLDCAKGQPLVLANSGSAVVGGSINYQIVMI
jgi:hypothetical protein